ncbi:MAG: protoporphyrinogen oxidase HemJ [Flammeovirgaceae bacterium]
MILTAIPWYLIAKSVHIIGIVSWFAGLFYWVRIFIYHVEAEERPEEEKSVLQAQFALMEKRVYKIITNPAMVITLIAGVGMLYLRPGLLQLGWMHVKLTLVVLLIGYQHFCVSIMKKLEKGTNKLTGGQLRGINEIATLFLVAIVVLAVMKSLANFAYVFIALVILGVLMFLGIKAYKKVRLKEEGKA